MLGLERTRVWILIWCREAFAVRAALAAVLEARPAACAVTRALLSRRPVNNFHSNFDDSSNWDLAHTVLLRRLRQTSCTHHSSHI